MSPLQLSWMEAWPPILNSGLIRPGKGHAFTNLMPAVRSPILPAPFPGGPTGKSPKTCQALTTQTILFSRIRICRISESPRPEKKGRFASRHETRVGMWWTRAASAR